MRTKVRGYDEVCNHCGKDIHPPRMDNETQAIDESMKQQDCIWVERHTLRGGGFQHPMTNYICLDCSKELAAWLHAAWAKP